MSVLEGGYNINGGIVSAFARSVAAHVRALAEPHSQVRRLLTSHVAVAPGQAQSAVVVGQASLIF